MAQRVESRVVTCSSGTTEADAVEVDVSFQAGTVLQVELLIPDGHAGQTGIAIAQAHQIIIPATGTDWIVGNDNRIVWTVADFLNTGEWSAFVYNNGDFDHSWYVTFLINENTDAVIPASSSPLPVADIMLGQAA